LPDSVQKFEEIEAKRIRIVDADGTVRMVLTVPPLPDATYRGKPMVEQNRQEAGLIFYNDEGTECGGLTFHGRTVGGKPDAGMILAFDQYESDQVLFLQYTQVDKKRGYGLSMVDRPLTPINELVEKQVRVTEMADGEEKQAEMQKLREGHSQRLFVGRTDTGEVCLYLMDSMGRPRVRVAVDSEDNPKMEFMNEAGDVTYSVPPA
jgi:hypothetical protein